MSALLTRYKQVFEKMFSTIAKLFLKIGLGPDHLTILSLFFSTTALVSAYFFPL